MAGIETTAAASGGAPTINSNYNYCIDAPFLRLEARRRASSTTDLLAYMLNMMSQQVD